MADNLTLNDGTGTGILATAELSWSGDTSHIQVITHGLLSGSEGSWSFTTAAGGAGAVSAGTARVTLASDDPGVALLTTIDADTGVINTNIATLAGAVTGTEMQVDVVTLPNVTIGAALPAGSNAIGKLAANSGVDIGDVDVLSQPARDRLTDNVGVALQTDALLNDTTALTPKFAVIDAATSGDNTLIAAVTSKKIRVLSAFLVASAAVTVRFESGASGTALTGQMNLAANGGFALPFNPLCWFETGSNTLLNLELSGAISVDGCLTYVEV